MAYNMLNFSKICLISEYQVIDTADWWLPEIYFLFINKTPILLDAVQFSPQWEIAFLFFQWGRTYDIWSNEIEEKFMSTMIWKIYRMSSSQRPKAFLVLLNTEATILSMKTKVSQVDKNQALLANESGFYFQFIFKQVRKTLTLKWTICLKLIIDA